MNNKPIISVVICTRNRADSLNSALEYWLQVSYEAKWEIVIIDNLSTDNTSHVIDKFIDSHIDIRSAVCSQVGLGAAREHGRKIAIGSIIVFTDDDCYPAKDLLSQYAQIFSIDQELGYCGGRILLWDESDAYVTVDYRSEVINIPAKYLPLPGDFHGANLAFRSVALGSIGGVDSNLGAGTPFPCEDIDMVCRASMAGYSGRFDPKAVIFHHHGRKTKDVSVLMRLYSMGRGAYYAKFLLDARSRVRIIKHLYWLWRFSFGHAFIKRDFGPLSHRLIELKSAIRYCFKIAILKAKI